MSVLRKILFYLFCTAYLFLCPMVILQTLGITFESETQTLEKTGIIYLSTIPTGADIYVRNKKHPVSAPAIIRNLSPGLYPVTITLKGHKPWKKNLPVKAEQATSVEHILLVPDRWESRPLFRVPIEELVPLDGQKRLLFSQGPYLKDLYCYDTNSPMVSDTAGNQDRFDPSNLQPLFPQDFPYNTKKYLKKFTADDSPFILIPVKTGGTIRYFWLDTSQTPAGIKNISPLFATLGMPDRLLWNKDTPGSLIALLKGTVYHLDVDNMEVNPPIAKNVLTATLYRHYLYVLTKNYIIRKFDLKGNMLEAVLEDPETGRSLFEEGGDLAMSVFSNRFILLQTERGALISNLLPHRLIDKDVSGFSFDKDSRKLLVWTHNRIGLLDFKPDIDEGVFEKGPDLTWLDISPKSVRQAFTANQGAQVIYQDRDNVLITETRTFEQPATYSIVTVRRGTSVQYADQSGRLYYIDHSTSYPSYIQIKPENSFFPLPGIIQAPESIETQNEI